LKEPKEVVKKVKSTRKSLVFLCDQNGRPIDKNSEDKNVLKQSTRNSSNNSTIKKEKGKDYSIIYKSTPSKTNLKK
jgi:hypothetical protein